MGRELQVDPSVKVGLLVLSVALSVEVEWPHCMKECAPKSSAVSLPICAGTHNVAGVARARLVQGRTTSVHPHAGMLLCTFLHC